MLCAGLDYLAGLVLRPQRLAFLWLASAALVLDGFLWYRRNWGVIPGHQDPVLLV